LNQLKNNRPTIAVLTNVLSTPFWEGVLFGATDYARKLDYNILCFAGAQLSPTGEEKKYRARVFDLIDVDLIDAVIVPMGALSRFISKEDQLSFLQKFKHVPVITINSDLPGYTDISYSPQQGMFELVEHLVKQHQVKRFVFTGANGTHRSTTIKKKLFKDALKNHGIVFNEDMYITSDMRRNSPIPGLENLFSGNKTDWPQAIVAASDNQALDILMHLNQIGIRVPEDVIVTGSTGQEESQFSDPPLTSIIEPTYELGWHAAEYAVAAINNKPFKDNLLLPTSLIVRRSCGCRFHGNTESSFDVAGITVQDETLLLDFTKRALEAVIQKALPEQRVALADNTAEQLSLLLLKSLHSSDSSELLSLFNQHLELSVKSKVFFLWEELGLCLHNILMQLIAANHTHGIETKIAAGLFQLIQNYNETAGQYRSFEANKYVGLIREVGIRFNGSFNPEAISALLSQGLNISDCYLSIFEELGLSEGVMSNVMATRDNRSLALSDSLYSATKLIPPGVAAYDKPFYLLILPLSFREEFLGLCVLSLGDRKSVIYESLLTIFSSALKNRMHLRHLSEAEKKFRDIAHSASDWLWEIDTEGCFKYCSDGVEQVLGYSAEELIDKPLNSFLEHPDPSYVKELMKSMESQDGLVLHECSYRHKQGNKRILLTTGKPIIKFDQVIGYRGAYKDISEVKAQEASIRKLAYFDTLTNLPNRTLFNDRLARGIKRARRTHSEFAVLFIDLDGFKLINDSMGHDAGDLLLGEVAKLFNECIDGEDTLARFGGDEFAIVLPNVDVGVDASIVAERIIKTLSNSIKIRNQSVFITASIGIALFPDDGKTIEVLLKNADKAMYRSKEKGKNCYCFYESELEDTINRTVMIRNLLYNAVRDDGFDLLYQPQVNNMTGEISGVEALIRLSDTGEQYIGPDEFIPLAEEIGLIDEIGLWVFKTACEQQKRWEKSGLYLNCSINVSAKQFRNLALAEQFISIIHTTGVDPKLLTIEITENAVIEDEYRTCQILNKLTKIGVSTAIDDFGTGYASLSCLRKIPVNILKIDRSFVLDCETNEDNGNIIAAIVMMAKSLKLSTVAEGVETQENLDFLNQIGCDEMQGYLFSKPVDAQKIPTLVSDLASHKQSRYFSKSICFRRSKLKF